MSTGYSRAFFETQRRYANKAAKHILEPVLSAVRPKSILDVGCGTGGWLAFAKSHGVRSITGVDGDYLARDQLLIKESEFVTADLTKNFSLRKKFDLVICTEVGEHLPKSAAPTLVRTLTAHGDIVLFSAAIPYQAGADDRLHPNEQWQSYWAALFRKRGFVALDCMRGRLWHNKDVPSFYAQNLIVYIRNGIGQDERVARLRELTVQNLDIVHPEFYLPRAKKTVFVEKFVPSFAVLPIHRFINSVFKK
jgi:SAM-dependent methyltransferase